MNNKRRLNIGFTAEALEALQKVVEIAMTTVIDISNHYSIYAKYVTLMHKNIRLIYSLIDIWNLNSWLSNVKKEDTRWIYRNLPM